MGRYRPNNFEYVFEGFGKKDDSKNKSIMGVHWEDIHWI